MATRIYECMNFRSKCDRDILIPEEDLVKADIDPQTGIVNRCPDCGHFASLYVTFEDFLPTKPDRKGDTHAK